MSVISDGISAHTNDGRERTSTVRRRSTMRPRGAATGITWIWFARAAAANASPCTSCTCARRTTIATSAISEHRAERDDPLHRTLAGETFDGCHQV